MRNRLQRKKATLLFKTRKFNRTPLKVSTKENSNLSSIFLAQAAIVVLLLTALAYSFTALFKYGYHSYYYLNSFSLIKIDMNDLLNYFTIVFPFIGSSLIVYFLLFILYKSLQYTINLKTLDKQSHYTLILSLFIFVPIALIFKIDISNYLFSYISPICIVILFASYNYLPKKVQLILKKVSTPLYHYPRFTIISLLIFTGLSSFQLGVQTASDQKDYLIFKKDNIDYIVISSSNNNLISAPLNSDNKSINPIFKIISPTDNLVLENVTFSNGLKVKKPKEIK